MPWREGGDLMEGERCMPMRSMASKRASRMNWERSEWPEASQARLMASRRPFFTMKVRGYWSLLRGIAFGSIRKNMGRRNFFLVSRFELG